MGVAKDEIPMEEVMKHTTSDSAWLSIHGKVRSQVDGGANSLGAGSGCGWPSRGSNEAQHHSHIGVPLAVLLAATHATRGLLIWRVSTGRRVKP